MRPSVRVLACTAALAASLAASAAWAVTVSYTVTVPLQTTNWSQNLTFPKFNGGMLQSVSLAVRDSLVSGFRFENLSTSSGATMRDSTKCTIQVLRPDNTPMLSTVSVAAETAMVAVYDGTLDYAGASGRTFDPVVNVSAQASSFATGADLALFSGTGNISLPCSATGWGYLSSTGGNNRNSITTQGGATVTVTYTFLSLTPSPTLSWGTLRRLYR